MSKNCTIEVAGLKLIKFGEGLMSESKGRWVGECLVTDSNDAQALRPRETEYSPICTRENLKTSHQQKTKKSKSPDEIRDKNN